MNISLFQETEQAQKSNITASILMSENWDSKTIFSKLVNILTIIIDH